MSGQTPEMARAQTMKPSGRERHVPAQAAELLQLGRAGLLLDRAGGQEQAALVHGVVDHVEEAADDADGHGRADAQDHVADLADGVVGEQPLVVLLDEGHDDGQDDGHGADDHQQERAGRCPARA